MRLAGLVLTLTLVAGTAAALTIEAETAPIRSAGAAVKGSWNLHSNGHVGAGVAVAKAGRHTIIVRAHGTPAAGVWPRMVVRVGPTRIGQATVDRREFADYRFEADLAAGTQKVLVEFDNDAVVDGEDRNLYLDRIVIEAPPGAPEPAIASFEDMAVEARKIEDAAVAQASRDIETVRKSDVTLRIVGPDGRPAAGASVSAELLRHEFLFGCNIYRFDHYDTAEKNAAYKRRFRELFNAATVAFYWRGYERERGKPRYPYTDTVVAWCREHGIRMKGHPLLWDHRAGRPRWADDRQPPPDVQKQRVQEIVRRYAGKIEFWEVVNEPSHCRRVTIDQPYRWARDADPKAYLIVNDYYVMANGYPPFHKLLTKAIADGVPFDGIGIQAHEPRTMRFPLDSVKRTLDHYAELGKELHITEFTPTTGGQKITGSHVQGVWNEEAQADYAVKFYTVCFAHPAVVAITWWDLCEDGAWLQGGGLLRKDLTPKKVYTDLRKLIHEDWHTQAEGKADAEGRFRFRGFHGTYAVTVNGKRFDVRVPRGADAEIEVGRRE
jgi:GH35 family endo-1,4-beta-xylanase